MTKTPVPDTDNFTCDVCHRTFPKAWTDEEALAEAKKAFGADVASLDNGVVCEDCYQQFQKWRAGLSPDEEAKLARQSRAPHN